MQIGSVIFPIVAVAPRRRARDYEYEVVPDGTHLSTRQPEGYFKMMVDFFGDVRLHGTYGADLMSSAPANK